MQQICKELEKGGIDKQALNPLQTKLEQLSKQMSLRASLETVQQVGLAQNSLETIKQAALAQGAPLEEVELIIKHGEERLQKAENSNAQHEIQLQMTQAIQHLGETSQLAQKIGNKAANLHRLDKLFPGQVPYHRESSDSDVLAYVRQRSPQFDHLWQQVVDYLNQGGAIEQADHLLDPIQEEIKRVFAEATDFPNDADLKAFQALGHPIIVRSTSREDTLKVANQGGGTSVPNISPNRESIQKMNPFGIVLASYFSKKSFVQRKAQGDNLTELPFMAVAIQVMKSPAISGVMFSTEGELNTPGVCQISADFGFAGVVTGARPSDTYYVQDQFVHAVVAEKFVRDVPQADGMIAAVANSAKLQKRPCLTEEQALHLSKMAKRIEEEYGYPMDIEWGYDIQTDTFYLFQARPIPLKEPSQPSYLDPEKMKNLKDMQYMTVIGAGSAEVKELKQTNTIIANSAPLALKEYLENPNRPYQAILIGNPTAHNSHEAGFFRQRGIPLIYLTADQYNHATIALKTQTLLADTQEGVLATLPPDQPTKDFICEGLRHHVVPKMESLGRKLASWELSAFRKSLEEKAQGANLAQIPQTIGRNLLDRALNAFEQAERLEEKAYILQKLIEIVESKLKKVPESERQEILDKIFYNAQHVWKVYQNPQMEEVNHKFAISWLRTALLRSPVEGVVKSGTLYQTLGGIKERGQLKLAAHEMDSKAAYLDIFQRSQKFIFSPTTRENWKTFISHLKEEDLQQLAMLFAKLGPSIVEVWLNSRFPAIWQKQQNSSICLKAALKELVGSEIDQSLALSKQASALTAQFNASDFSDPTQFNQFNQELKEKLLPLALNCVDKMKNAKEVDRTLLAHTFGKLVATFDNCIKNLTTSTLYNDQQKAEYFGALLDSYVNLAEAAMDQSILKHDPTLARQASRLTPYLKTRLTALKKEAKNNPSGSSRMNINKLNKVV